MDFVWVERESEDDKSSDGIVEYPLLEELEDDIPWIKDLFCYVCIGLLLDCLGLSHTIGRKK
jgi:hypothetical protein